MTSNLPMVNPAFPDIVGQLALADQPARGGANDNDGDLDGLSDPLLALVARAEIEATRLW